MIEKLPPKLMREVKKVYKPGMSITEIEVRLFLHLNTENRHNMLCFMRDPTSLKYVYSNAP